MSVTRPTVYQTAPRLYNTWTTKDVFWSPSWEQPQTPEERKKYGMAGSSHDLGKSGMSAAYTQLKGYLEDGPVIVSVHYKMDPKSTIPHLVVVTGIDGDTVYYNDPAAKAGGKSISSSDFKKAWKKRFIVVRPMIATKAKANT